MSRTLPSTAAPTTAIDAFFDDHTDLVSEIMSFLDLHSLMRLCNTSKKPLKVLRYEHVFTSTQKKTSYKNTNEDARKRTTDRNAIIILNKLSQVYKLSPSSPTTMGSKKSTSTSVASTGWIRSAIPSPIRLLRLVNGRRCEKCHSNLISPCVWAGTSGFGQIVLPSLSFGQFCCTQCIFDASKHTKTKDYKLQNNRRYLLNDSPLEGPVETGTNAGTVSTVSHRRELEKSTVPQRV